MFNRHCDALVFIFLIFGKTTESDSQSTDGTKKGCVLPPHPDNGYWTIQNGAGEPDDIVASSSILQFHCVDGYKLSNTPFIFCTDNNWNVQEMPFCQKLCPPIYPTSTTILNCIDKLGHTINCTEATEETILTYECSPFYEVPFGRRRSNYCLDGMWHHPKPECQPVCGKKVEAKPLIYGGRPHDKIEYPWIVALYMKENNDFMNVCGGTIISTNVVLTAAHCVTNDYADALPADLFTVAATKLYNKFNDSRDTDAQYIQVSRIIVHSQYQGDSRRFLGDIALLVTKNSFKLSSQVQPACVTDLNTKWLQPGAIGETAGWGVTEYNLPAKELRSIEIMYQTDAACWNTLPEDWAKKYHLLDKMCAGDPKKNISVCKGDSGSGLVFKNIDDDRYYVHGVVSIAPFASGSSCNIINSALFTKVAFYYDFIDIELSKIDRCRLPPFPKNGKWILENDESKVPENFVPPHEVLKFVCDKGYRLTTSSSTFVCEVATSNMPSCQATFDEHGTSSALGTSASEIEAFLETVDCGRKVNESESKMSNIPHSEYPWAVAVYNKQKFLGPGTLISRRVTLSKVRTLVEDDRFTVLDPRTVEIGFGQFYKYYGDPRNPDAQYLEASDIIISHEKGKGYGNIGIVVTKEAVNFNQWIKPICIKGLNKLQLLTGDVGIVYGWSNKKDSSTDILIPMESTYKSRDICIEETPSWWYATSKNFICGAAPNKTGYYGDLGSGWVFKNPQNNRYYIHGILTGFLDDLPLGENNAFLNVSYHYNLIMSNIRKYG